MKKNYQKNAAPAAIGDELVLPDAVSVAMADISGAVREGLLRWQSPLACRPCQQ